ncbi:MAG: FecR domain-containing protein [Planctomycetota bacterium]
MTMANGTQAHARGEDELDLLLEASFSDHPFGEDAVAKISARIAEERRALASREALKPAVRILGRGDSSRQTGRAASDRAARAASDRAARVGSGRREPAPTPTQTPAQHEQPSERRASPLWVGGLSLLAAGLLGGLALSLVQHERAPSRGGATKVAAAAPELLGEAGEGLMIVGPQGQRPLRAGEPIRAGQRLLAIAHPAAITLRDGTRLDLHGDTELCLRRDGDGGLSVQLQGAEGSVFCEVAKQHAPFRVVARDLSVEVLGTRFLVEQGVSSSRCVVVEGRVRARTSEQAAVLLAGDRAEAVLDRGLLELTQVTPRREAMWVPRLREEQRELERAEVRREEARKTTPVVPAPAPPPEVPPPQLDQPVVPPRSAKTGEKSAEPRAPRDD